LAHLQADLGEIETAISTIKLGIYKVPTDYYGHLTLGDLYKIQGQPDQAREIYEEALAKIPGASLLHTRIGDIYTDSILEMRKKLSSAKSLELLAQYRLETVQELQSASITKVQKRATELKLRDALESYTESYNILLFASRSFEQAEEEFESARLHYQSALDLHPNNEFALLGLGKLYMTMGETEDGLTYLESAVDVKPTSILSLSYLGNTYLELNRIDEAVAIFQQILTHDPNNLLAHLGISKAYELSETVDITEAAATVAFGLFQIESQIDNLRIPRTR
jgi:tetratricopeptide (TPR) repeat protein